MSATAQLLRCSPMATDIPQRDLRNRTAELLRRVETGERLRITVHGHPVADLAPIEEETPAGTYAPLQRFFGELAGALDSDDRWADEIRRARSLDGPASDPFERFEESSPDRPDRS
jgi:prevent-host-death family protein